MAFSVIRHPHRPADEAGGPNAQEKIAEASDAIARLVRS
jgi:hypothetical protein